MSQLTHKQTSTTVCYSFGYIFGKVVVFVNSIQGLLYCCVLAKLNLATSIAAKINQKIIAGTNVSTKKISLFI